MNYCKACGKITSSVYHTPAHIVCYSCLEKAIVCYLENQVPSLHDKIRKLEALVKVLEEEQ